VYIKGSSVAWHKRNIRESHRVCNAEVLIKSYRGSMIRLCRFSDLAALNRDGVISTLMREQNKC